MADEQNDAQAPETPENPVVAESSPVADTIEAPAVSGPSRVEESTPIAEPQIDVVKEQVAAQVVQPREPDSDTVNVHETSIALDRRVDYAIVPPEGRGFLDLPLHALSNPRPEDVFDAAREDES